MPRKVDHEERRLAIAAIVEQLVYERGVEALTIRDISEKVGISTTVVSHYFRSKLDILIFTHQTARSRTEKTLQDALDRGKSLGACLEILLPTTEERWRDWHTFFAFWGMAPENPSVSDEWSAGTSGANTLFAKIVMRAQEIGAIDPAIDPRAAATEIQVYINGIATLVAQDRKAWPAKRQKQMLHDLLSSNLARPRPE
ncbi:putative TetR family transcriptional regulator [Caenibius tardaugens NBRC 16725]|uniref:Putative TetR family transcriptional regulator n=1 Tax=Caenibius tardaugens NBRC 16725 TaxID=1219035 RepID=U2YMP4_9SPHN|nr:TetR/AcrR family transcriptional regulator [Caenibius tardaugens]GAD50035.1 putative TetR family transcriptional regulator [Caenibius tardaugens NBRC 16725]